VTNDLIAESHQALVHHFEMQSSATQQGMGLAKDGLGSTIMESSILSNTAKWECAPHRRAKRLPFGFGSAGVVCIYAWTMVPSKGHCGGVD
jgi:hypothetical protein